jgi:uncharacterized protein YndB with AHSA1/START domain
MSTDKIVKQVVLHAPLVKVWSAISDARRFGTWFGVAFEGAFVVGATLRGTIVPTKVDAEVAKQQAPYAGAAFELVVEAIEPMQRFAFRWHPFAIDPKVDYSREPMTLVELVLEEVANGTRLTITESGFDSVPADRRAAALRANDGGWASQLVLIEKYVIGG